MEYNNKKITNYRIDEDGTVWSIRRNKPIAQRLNSSGYLRCTVRDDEHNRVDVLIHRALMFNFKDGYFEGATVDHIDGNKLNNSLDNLEWVTAKENLKRSWEDTSNRSLHLGKRVAKYDLNGRLLDIYDSIAGGSAALKINRRTFSYNLSKGDFEFNGFVYKLIDEESRYGFTN